MDVYSVQLLDQARWQAELFAMDRVAEYQLEKALPLAEAAVTAATEAVATVNGLAPAVDDALAVAKSAPELVCRERDAAIEAARNEVSRTIEFVQAERIAALEYLTRERESALMEMHQAIIDERVILTADLERISVNVVDHAVLRAAQLAGGVLFAVFIGVLVLLCLVRRMFAAPPTKDATPR
jgi:hypothetical protein